MTKTDFKKLLERDGAYCLHCGETERLVPNHRANRGMGGSKVLDVPSNLVLICSDYNGLIESNAWHGAVARENGLKVSKWDNPKDIPVLDQCTGVWYLLNDDWSRTVVS